MYKSFIKVTSVTFLHALLIFPSMAWSERNGDNKPTSQQESQQTSSKSSGRSSQELNNTNQSSPKNVPVSATIPSSDSGAGSAFTNVQASSVSVESFTGSAGLAIPITVPPGRGGIEPRVVLAYSSTGQLGLAGLGWNIELGAISRSSKRGVPTYDDSKDTFIIMQGSAQELVKDPTSNRFYPEIEGEFNLIQKFTDHWKIKDKKGVTYYFGNSSDSRLFDASNPSRIVRWALNRIEDINGNFLTISYRRDQNQIYPDSIDYGGNSAQAVPHYGRVSFNYKPITNSVMSFSSGFKVVTSQVVDTISTFAKGILQAKYILNYQPSAATQKTLLKSIQQTVNDVEFLPAITFNYSDVGNKGWQKASGWNLPWTSFPSLDKIFGLRATDLNADGYGDLIHWDGDGQRTLLNGKNNGWVQTTNWQPGVGFVIKKTKQVGTVVQVIYEDTSLRLMDANADGKTDIVTNYLLNGLTPSQKIGINDTSSSAFSNLSGFTLPLGTEFATKDDIVETKCLPIACRPMPTCQCRTTIIGQTTTVTGAIVGDINGDGFDDIVRSNQSHINYHKTFLHNANTTTPAWNASSQLVPPDSPYTDLDNGAVLIDLNGDGLPDFLYSDEGTKVIFMNTGTSWVQDINSPWLSIPSDRSTKKGTIQFNDVNGDGLVDMLIFNDAGSDINGVVFPTFREIYINTGFGWHLDTSWNLSSSFRANNFRFLDANGDGLQDFLQLDNDPFLAGFTRGSIYLNQAVFPDLLTSVSNGAGAQTSITYESALRYPNTFLPFALPVVKSTTISVANPIGPITQYTTQYSYSEGKWDPSNREFQGFGMVKAIDPDGNYVISKFLQDHWLQGRPYEQYIHDNSGTLYSKKITQWQTQNLMTNGTQTAKFVFLKRLDDYIYDGSTTAKRAAQEFTYGEFPQYGNPTQVINYGEVDAATGVDIGSDKIISLPEYYNNSSAWILGLPKVAAAKDINNNLISKTSFYYDGSIDTTTLPTKGQLTSKINWLGDAVLPDPQYKYTYSPFGNLESATDPLGRTSTITYDNDVHLFPVIVNNVLQQSTITKYYGVADGDILGGRWGQMQSTTNINGQSTIFKYDNFGRLTVTIEPLDTLIKPSLISIYEFNTTYSKITTKSRLEHNSDKTIDSVTYYDGLGRVIEKKSLGSLPGQFIVAGHVEYNSRGLPIRHYQPRYTNTELNTMDPINASIPSSQTVYDPMSRIIKTINPDGSFTNVQYSNWTTTTFDENGHMQRTSQDAFGRPIRKEEFKGADGRASDYPASTYVLYATTNYTYDPAGNLTSITDTKGNQTRIFYDHLNRKTRIDDPDMGSWSYGYDSNSNLIWQKDAKVQTIRFSYDALNRLLNKTDGIPTGPINNFPNVPTITPTFNVAYHYDDSRQDFGKGRLGDVAYDLGSAVFTYDVMGRIIVSTKKIDNITYNVTHQYDALNRLKQIQYPDGAQVQYIYNQAGQVISVTDVGAVVNGQIVIPTPVRISNSNTLSELLGVKDAHAAGSNMAPTVNLTYPPPTGFGTSAWAEMTLTATASDSDGTITKVEFFNGNNLIGTSTTAPYSFDWTHIGPGVYSIVAKATDNNGSVAVSSASPITVNSLNAHAILVRPGDASTINIGDITLETVAFTSYGPVSRVEFYNGTTLLTTMTAPTSVDSSGSMAINTYIYTWRNVPAGSYNLTVKAYNNGNVGISAPVRITVAAINPIVTLTSPKNNAVLPPGSITLSANALAMSGKTINGVIFFSGSDIIGSAVTPPYNFVWTGVVPGTYALRAEAHDNQGKFGSSSISNITVAVPKPKAGLGVTTDNIIVVGTTLYTTTPANVQLRATGQISAGTISKVELYNGTVLLGTSTTTPYNYNWNNIPSGNYSFYSKAYSGTQVAVSDTFNLTVAAPNQLPPSVSLSTTGNTTSFASPAALVLTANAQATNGPGGNTTVNKVEFYNGTNLLATMTASPYTYTWSNVSAGQYALTAKVYDSNNRTALSNVLNITVTGPQPKPSAYLGVSLDSVYVVGTTVYTVTPTTITITGSGKVASGSISKVEIYNGSTLLGTSTTTPYTYNWNNIPPGTYSFNSKVYANNQVTTTDSYNVTVVTSTGLPPSVSLSKPNSSNGNVMLTANAQATNVPGGTNTITKVELYSGSTLVGLMTGNPFKYNWTSVPAGNYTLTAKAYDNNGNTAMSNAVPVKVSAPNQYIRNVDYNALGQVTQIQYGNGVTTAYTYYSLNNRLKRIYTSNAQAQRIQDLTYTYDAGGQILSIVDALNTATQSFKYDELNRLIWAQGSYGTKIYVYDEIGNILQKDGLTYNYAELNSRLDGSKAGPHAVTSLSNGTVFKYDANGNMSILIKGNETTSYSYDKQNRLSSVSSQTGSFPNLSIAQYSYDGDGSRVKKTIYRRDKALYNLNTEVLLFGSLTIPPKLATTLNPTPEITKYIGQVYEETGSRHTNFVFLGSLRVAAISGSEVMYYHPDHLGGSNVLSDKLGMPRELTEYDPFGVVLKHEKYGNDFDTAWYYFTGKLLDDETGLMYYAARYYNPKLGRFITSDIIVGSVVNPQSLNRYSYTENNPINYNDPTGHKKNGWYRFWDKWGGLFGITGMFIQVVVTGNVDRFANMILAMGTAALFSGGNPFAIAASVMTSGFMDTPPGQQFNRFISEDVFDNALGMRPRVAYFMGNMVSTAIVSSAVYIAITPKTYTGPDFRDTKNQTDDISKYGLYENSGGSTGANTMAAEGGRNQWFEQGRISSQNGWPEVPILRRITQAAQINHTAAVVQTSNGTLFDSAVDTNLVNPLEQGEAWGSPWTGTCHQVCFTTLVEKGGASGWQAFNTAAKSTGWSYYITSAIYGVRADFGGVGLVVGTKKYFDNK